MKKNYNKLVNWSVGFLSLSYLTAFERPLQGNREFAEAPPIIYEIGSVGLSEALALELPPSTTPNITKLSTEKSEPDVRIPNGTNVEVIKPNIVFCGANPHDPYAETAVESFAGMGVQQTKGPCMEPPSGSTSLEPGSRYVSPEDYMKLALLNGKYGMKTVIYEPRFWSEDKQVRDEAISYWKSVKHLLGGVDTGDEFYLRDSRVEEEVARRYSTIARYVTPELGIYPTTNNLAYFDIIKQVVKHAGAEVVTYNLYNQEASVALAKQIKEILRPGQKLGCTVAAMEYFGANKVTSEKLQADVEAHKEVCDVIEIFGGVSPYKNGIKGQDPNFENTLVNKDGTPNEKITQGLKKSLTIGSRFKASPSKSYIT